MTEYREIQLLIPTTTRHCSFMPIHITGFRREGGAWQSFYHTVRMMDLGPMPWDAETVEDLVMRLDNATTDTV